MMTGNTAIHIASQLQSGAPRKAAFLVAVRSNHLEKVRVFALVVILNLVFAVALFARHCRYCNVKIDLPDLDGLPC